MRVRKFNREEQTKRKVQPNNELLGIRSFWVERGSVGN